MRYPARPVNVLPSALVCGAAQARVAVPTTDAGAGAGAGAGAAAGATCATVPPIGDVSKVPPEPPPHAHNAVAAKSEMQRLALKVGTGSRIMFTFLHFRAFENQVADCMPGCRGRIARESGEAEPRPPALEMSAFRFDRHHRTIGWARLDDLVTEGILRPCI